MRRDHWLLCATGDFWPAHLPAHRGHLSKSNLRPCRSASIPHVLSPGTRPAGRIAIIPILVGNRSAWSRSARTPDAGNTDIDNCRLAGRGGRCRRGGHRGSPGRLPWWGDRPGAGAFYRYHFCLPRLAVYHYGGRNLGWLGRYLSEQHPSYRGEWQCSPVTGLAGSCFRGVATDGALCERAVAAAQKATNYRRCVDGG